MHYGLAYGHNASRTELEGIGLWPRAWRGVAHFHIEGPGFRASVGIATLMVIVGAVPSKVLRDASEWAREHRAELLAKWQELNP